MCGGSDSMQRRQTYASRDDQNPGPYRDPNIGGSVDLQQHFDARRAGEIDEFNRRRMDVGLPPISRSFTGNLNAKAALDALTGLAGGTLAIPQGQSAGRGRGSLSNVQGLLQTLSPELRANILADTRQEPSPDVAPTARRARAPSGTTLRAGQSTGGVSQFRIPRRGAGLASGLTIGQGSPGLSI